ncbi:WYL domain-containing protein [Echinicola jeungdonensis]|uniref:Helix-turn-helix transcriptional regulator n=1 Tax=Echinicola jeungdonensis TaxID=709343 RepID=A0ABV5J1G6_9BACT|nr:WYL domain-containing protein [Echinicola jeungdonensis]MDN3667802.1 WYL domain-containing protein [Echinicola jeungdonensis]
MKDKKKIEQQKILRVFKLINLLRSNVGKSVGRLAESLETDKRTIYRYLKLLEELGFQVEKEYSKFKIANRVEHYQGTFYGTFTDEEAAFLGELISKSREKNFLKDAILQKVQLRSDFQQSLTQLFNANLGMFVDEIADSIKNKYQVLLKDYYSLNSDVVSDRLVEPVAFNRNFESVYAFEVESKEMKLFKLERISELLVSKKKFQFEPLHKQLEQGLFGFTGKDQFEVKLKLSKKAYQLLIEEHPDTRPFTYVKGRGNYYFETQIPELPGIARFILGLPGEVEVVKGNELKQYLGQKLKKAENFFSAQ